MAARAAAHDGNGGDGVFEDELFLLSGFQNNRILVEATDAARQFDAADEVNRYQRTLAAHLIEKGVLKIL